jgi:hypothetical protein
MPGGQDGQFRWTIGGCSNLREWSDLIICFSGLNHQ